MKLVLFIVALFIFWGIFNNVNAQTTNFLWAKQIGGIDADIGNCIKIDAGGNVYVSGNFSGVVDFDPGPSVTNLTSNGAKDVFISKFDATGKFVWVRQIGGLFADIAYSMALDVNGYILITGQFEGSVDFDPLNSMSILTSFGLSDIFVVKLDALGNYFWAKQMGGLNVEVGYGIEVDANGNVYTTGQFYETCDFDPSSGVYNLISSYYSSDIFVSKLDSLGNFIWAKRLGGADFDIGFSIAIDLVGNVYTAGRYTAIGDFDPGPTDYILNGSGHHVSDIFISKLDIYGNFIWAKTFPSQGFSQIWGKSIVVDANENVYTSGSFYGSIDFDPGQGSFLLSALGYDIFVSKLDNSGGFIWAKQMGGVCTDIGLSLVIDANSNVYTAGYFSCTADFDPGPQINSLTSFGSTDIFVSKLDPLGNFISVKQLGGVNQDTCNSITIDAFRNVYSTGVFTSSSDFDPGNDIYNLTSNGGTDVFVVKLREYQTPHQLSYIPVQNAITPNGKQVSIADPIQLGTGTYYYNHNDFTIPAIGEPLNFSRSYNSLNESINGPLGSGWSHGYYYFLENKQDTSWNIHYPDGHLSTFIPMNNSGQSFALFSGTTDSLQKNINATFTLFTKDKIQYHFDSSGRLDSIIDLNSNITRLYYTTNNLDSIIAPGGRSLKMTYTGDKIESVTDPLNRVISYTYDGYNNLIGVKDANNGIVTYSYDNAHRMLTVVNALGNIVIDNTYDTTGKVITQKDAYNQVTSIAYNSPNAGDATVTNPDNSQIIAHHDNFIRKTFEQDELGFTKTYVYDTNSNEKGFTNENNQVEARLFDSFGNLIADTLPGNRITQVTYNIFNTPVQIADANGNVKTHSYNSINNDLDSIRTPDNSLLIFSYYPNGQVMQSKDGNGNTTTYTYSGSGNLLSAQTFAGIKQYGYDAAGRKISVTDENGHTTNFIYDNNDNLLKAIDPLGRTIENTYDANSHLLSVKDRNGFLTTYSYDRKGRKTSSTNPKGGLTTYAYDVRDNLITVTDANNNAINYTYDKKGLKTSATTVLGTTQYQYDGAGNLIKEIDPTNKATEYTYTATNKIQSKKDGLNNTITYNYDNLDNLISVTDPLNRVTSYGFDVMNRLISVTDATNKSTAVTYDKNGNKKTVVDPNGHTQSYNYDAANRLVSYNDAAGHTYSYSYDSAGNNTAFSRPTGTITKTFDATNRAITVTNSSGDTYHFTYDNNDNVISMTNNGGTTLMAYDSLGQLKQYQDPYNKTVSYAYDAAGNKTAVIYPGNKTVSYTYDNDNNLKSVTDWVNHTFTYTYDAAGRTTQLLYPNGTRCNYEYDNAGRLLSRINYFGSDAIISGSRFALDATGNRVSEQKLGPTPYFLPAMSRAYNYGDDDRMLTDSIWNFTNDNSGNRISETNGTKTSSYTFSVDNLLNNSIDTSGTAFLYGYNPLGQRIRKVTGSITNKYLLDVSSSLSQILQITDASEVVKSDFVYGLGLMESIDAVGNPLYYHFDAQHNTMVLTDQNALIKDSYTYDPFGTLLNHTGTAMQPFTFLGEFGVEQESSEMFYARARYYDAANGRFISKDPVQSDLNKPQTINQYIYGVNNPAVNFDPSGLFSWQSFGVGTLQYIEGLGQLATAARKIHAASLPGVNSILGPSFVLSAGSSLNDATKSFKASHGNFINAFNSNSNWVESKSFKGALDFAYEEPSIGLLNNINEVGQGLLGVYNLTTNVPDAFKGITNSNYSFEQQNSFLNNYLLGTHNPFFDITKILKGVKSASWLNSPKNNLNYKRNNTKSCN